MSDNESNELQEEISIDREALVQVFLAESGEVLAAMEQELLALEANPDDEEKLHSLFRAAHTLKGSSSLVAFDAVRDLAHHLEGLLERLRARALRAEPGLVTTLLRGVDLLRSTIEASAAGGPLPAAALETFHEELRKAEGARQAAQQAAAPAPASAAPGAPRASPAARTLRVDVSKLDRMLNLSGEIAISRGRLTDMLERRTSLTVDEILEAHREADRLYLDLQDLIMKARMVPLGPSFQQHLRTVRDLAAAERKQVRLVLDGEDVEVDTAVVEHIRDPLTHMIRNAVDHGIESPEERTARGKDACGTLSLRASHEGGLVVIQVADDGGGLDRERILRRGVEKGLLSEGAPLTDEEIFGLIFEPGFSTSEQVTDVSGRGVGMDVVRRNVEALRGSVAVASEPGRGTTITLRFPLTLAIIQGFRVSVSDVVYIVPLDSVAECMELPAGAERGRCGVLDVRGQPLPFLRLREQFGLPGEPPGRENVVVVQHAGASVGLAVDALLGESQTVIKPLGRMFQGVRGISGSAILGDGRVALILDVPGLLREALARRACAEAGAAAPAPSTSVAAAAAEA
jgi:two-component system chemotaxis sensor kinase CheA